MRYLYLCLILLLLLSACSNDDQKAAVVIEETIERGAVLRTIALDNTTFLTGDSNAVFRVRLEEQDERDGNLMDRVDVYAQFVDRTPENGLENKVEVLIKTLGPEDFENGPVGLPRTTLEVPLSMLLSTLDLDMDALHCTDQFIIRLDIHLTDGRHFTEGDGSSWVIGLGSSFSSPYVYTVQVADAIEPAAFTGVYQISYIERGPFGVTFITDQTETVRIVKGHSPNVRIFESYYGLSHPLAEKPKFFLFTVACDQIHFGKHQFTSFEGYCNFFSPPILIGPGATANTANPNDDSVFILNVPEGYLGFDGGCGFGSTQSSMRFSKQ